MTLRIIQISDSHLSGDFPQRTADLEKCIEVINATDPQPDLVIHTGDVADYGRAEQYNIAKPVLDTLRAPYCVLAGNRDDRHELRKAFADNSLMQMDTNFIQYAIEDFDIRILVIDTLLERENKGQLCDARLDHFEQMLRANASKPVAVFMHHPPFEAHEIPDPRQFEQWEDVEKFAALLAKHRQIRGVYCGHLHRNIDAQVGVVPASSVSCLPGELRWGVANEDDRKLPMFRERVFS